MSKQIVVREVVTQEGLSECCGKEVTQRVFKNNGNGKIKPITHDEFEKMRGDYEKSGNHLWVPGIVFRWVCTGCGSITNPFRIFDGKTKGEIGK